MSTSQFLPSALFVATAVATWVLLYKSLESKQIMWLLAVIWIPMQMILAASGFYLDATGMPPRFALAIGPPLLFITLVVIFRRNYLLEASSLKWLTLLHVVRIAVETVLFFLFQIGEIPKLMTFEGSNPDILSGITAPLIWWCYRKGIVGNNGLLIWNLACLGLLFNIVIRAILSAPTPFQQFAFDQPNVALLKAPYVLLPAFIVPVVLFSHVVSIIKLTKHGMR